MEEKSDYQISTSVNEEILEIVISGEITKETADRKHAEVVNLVRAISPKALLLDIRALKRPSDQDRIAEVYFRVRSRPPEIRKTPSAVVALTEDTAYKTFYETTAANVNHSITFFSDIDAARAWLRGML